MVPTVTQMLKAYAEALKPWAAGAARRMLAEVDAADRDSWRSLGHAISAQLRHDIMHAPTGVVMRRLLHSQVDLITSLPTEAAQRVHELTLKGLENSSRAASYVAEIRRSGEVTQSRAVLIARTEVARTASVLTQTRAMSAGSTHYVWETSEDGTVRPGHQAMQGKVCEWANPPAVQENGKVMHFHPGTIWNCRCWPRPIITEQSLNA
jgi:SPP1 gp7 family putative phage head morphogenesis protein